MIDIHTHILPELDDGSCSVEESIEMLGILSKQGVDTVVATPHFYIDQMEPESFLQMRKVSEDKLKSALGESILRPRIAIGAEVQFYSEIHKLDCLEEFCISGTRYILIEMPFSPWTQHMFQTLEHLYTERNVTPIIAHLERYIDFQKKFKLIENINFAHALVQLNSEFIINKQTRRRALKLFKKEAVDFIGSDAHNTNTRSPVIKEAYDAVYQKLGDKGVFPLWFWEDKLLKDIITF